MDDGDEEQWLLDDAIIRERLLELGWERPTETGLAYPAHFSSSSGNNAIEIYHEVMETVLTVSIITPDGSVDVLTDYGDDPSSLLRFIEPWRSRLTALTYRQFIDDLACSFPNTYAPQQDARVRIRPREPQEGPPTPPS